jgi:Uma2 family endonuclease
MTVEEFLAFLDGRSSDERWELIDGVPSMTVGGTLARARISGNIDRLLAPAAEKRGCMSLRGFLVEANEISSFEPDVMVRCGEMEDASRRANDPVVVFEVLSPSTMRTDRVLKFERYRAIPSLQQIVFIYQDSVRIESWLRQQGDWREEPILLLKLDDSLAVPVLGAWLPLTEIYSGVRPGLYVE